MYTLTLDYNQNSIRTIQLFLQAYDPGGVHFATNNSVEAMEYALEEALDLVFLEIDMPDMSGFEVARNIRKLQPRIDIVFVTSNPKYAVQAFEMFASGYLVKPVRDSQLEELLFNLRYTKPVREPKDDKKLKVQCFGRFEAWFEGEPLSFRSEETKMLLAILVDRKGEMSGLKELSRILLPKERGEDPFDTNIRIWIADLQTTLTLLGIGGVLIREPDKIGINPRMLDCDYYEYENGGLNDGVKFSGEYMSQYFFDKKGPVSLNHRGGVYE